MNQNLFRLVFNAARGQVMAVSEVATAQGKSASGETSLASGDHQTAQLSPSRAKLGATGWAFHTMACAVVLACSGLSGSLHAQIIADPTAAGNARPQVINTANGLPQVNIQTPSAAGVSRNAYQQFDVNSIGALLNNSTGNVQTQLGGWIQGNGNLAAGAARVILNEVNSSNPSYLRGFVEVAGQRAEVIIANPSGINVDGGGFINASGVTLTTGTPQMNGGSLDGYRVQAGNVSISGAGLDTSTSDFTNIIARAVQVNKGIWAKDLKVTVGANEVNAANTSATPITGSGSVPTFALDVAALGGMYAGKITLVGTEAGVGVNNAGTIAASSGDLVLQVNGTLTNRGVLDGQTTLVKVDTLNNIGTGKIYGDHVAIQATTLNNDTETVNGATAAGLIAARTRLDIGATTLNNREHAQIISMGDVFIGGALDANAQATGRATDVNNASATIEAIGTAGTPGNISITTERLRNSNEHFTWDPETVTSIEPGLTINNTGSYYAVITRTTFDPRVTSTDPGKILASGNINLDIHDATNENSQILAGQALNVVGGTIRNLPVEGDHRINDKGTSYTWTIVGQECGWYNWSYRCSDIWGWAAAAYETNAITTVTVSEGASTPNASYTGTGTSSSSLFHTNAASNASYLVETDPRFTNMRNWLGSDYMLQSLALDPSVTQKRLGDGFYEQRLINEQIAQLTGRRFLENYSSDEQQYQALMNNAITYAQTYNLRPGIALSAAQIAQLTSDIVWLVEKEVALADGSLQKVLVPQVYAMIRDGDLAHSGALLSGDTVNIALSGDLNNSGTILGRQLVKIDADNLNNLGGTIQGQSVAVDTVQDINNIGGTIRARDALLAQAGGDLNSISTVRTTDTQQGISQSSRTVVDRVAGLYVTQNAGTGTLLASAGNDVNILAGIVDNRAANGSTVVVAGNNLNLGTVTTASSDNIQWDERNYRRASSTADAGSQITSAGATTLVASSDVNARAATVQAGGALEVGAGRDVTIAAGQSTATLNSAAFAESSGLLSSSSTEVRSSSSSTTVVASNFGGNSTTVVSGNNIGVKGSNLSATQDITLVAANDINVESATSTSDSSNFRRETQSGFSASVMSGISYGDSKQSQNATNQGTMEVASTISGANVSMQAGQDATIKASNVLADQDIAVTAGRNVNILAAANTQNAANQSESSSTSIGLAPGASARFTMFAQNSTAGNGTNTAVDVSTSLLSANNGNLTITSGTDSQYKGTGEGNVTTQGAELLAKDTITIEGNKVDLQAIANAQASSNHFESKSITVGSALTGVVGGALTSISDNIQLAQTTSNDRLKDAAALKAGYDAYKLANQVQEVAKTGASSMSSGGGIGVSVTLGVSSSSQDSSSANSQSRGTNAQANEIVVKATETDLVATAAKLQAENIRLEAARNVQLQAAANTATIASRNDSNNVGVGVTLGVGQQNGLSFQLSASQANGNANGSETTYDNTRVTASNTLTVKSGSDTNLKGAQLAGDNVKVDVGGNLNVETLQDSSTYASEQHSSGFNMSLCIPPLCYGTPVTASVSINDQSIDHNYQSAVGQSGIAAGQGGFDIKVGNNTDLKGAAITSSADASKNTLETASLTSSDLQNQQSTDSSSSNVTVGYSGASTLATLGQNAASNLLGKLGGGAGLPENGNQSSSTQSVISPATVTIKGTGDADRDANSATQVATLTSRDAATSNATLTNTLTLQQAQELQAKQKEAQEYAQTGQLVGSVAFNVVGDIAAKNQWEDSSPQKIALHAIAGYIQASASGQNGATGALAAMGNEAFTKVVNEYIDSALPMPENATAEQKLENELSRKALAESAASLIGASAVALAGRSNQEIALGGNVALTADRFNRQLHPKEVEWIKKNAKNFANKLDITEVEAEKRLAQQAFREVQFGVEGETDISAQAFLKDARNQLLPGDSSIPGQTVGYMFKADPIQKAIVSMYAGEVVNSPDTLAFYAKNGITQPTVAEAQAAAKKDASERQTATKATLGAAALAAATTVPPAIGWCLSNPIACNRVVISGGEIAAGDALGPTGLAIGSVAAGKAGLKAIKSAEEANAAMRAVGQQAAWSPGTAVISAELKVGTKMQMVVTEDQVRIYERSGVLPMGGWATFDDVASQAAARQDLALLVKFKTDVKYVIEYEVVKPLKADIGFVGKQTEPAGQTLLGGATQAALDWKADMKRTDYLKLVGIPKPLPVLQK